jgi:hypothetical protein
LHIEGSGQTSLGCGFSVCSLATPGIAELEEIESVAVLTSDFLGHSAERFKNLTFELKPLGKHANLQRLALVLANQKSTGQW